MKTGKKNLYWNINMNENDKHIKIQNLQQIKMKAEMLKIKANRIL